MARLAWTQLRSLILRRAPSAGEELADAALLERFVLERDQAAFELLVWRHGGLVFGACERILKESNAAEDAFQATFLILARKASTVRGSLPAWLHRCARRVAVRSAQWRTARREAPLDFDATAKPSPEPDPELRALLDAEIDRLPARFREAVILCYLDGRTTDEAAKILGIPRGTVLSRLFTARQKLSAQLRRRGIALPVVGSIVGTHQFANPQRVEACVSAALRYASGASEPSGAFQLAQGVLAMNARKMAILWGTTLVVVSGLATGVGVSASGQGPREAAAPTQPAPVAAKPMEPVRPAPPPALTEEQKSEQERAKRLARLIERATALEKARKQIDDKILELNAGIVRRERDVQNPIILKALGDVYSQAEISAFQLELDIKATQNKLAPLKERITLAEAAEISPRTLEGYMSGDDSLQNSKSKVARLKLRLADAKKVVKEDSPTIKTLEIELVKANDELDTVKKEAETAAKKSAIASRTSGARSALNNAESELKTKTEQKQELDRRRIELRKRIEDASQASAELETIRAEVQILRDQSRQLRQEQFDLSFQLGKHARSEDMDRILKELAELRAEVKALKDGKK